VNVFEQIRTYFKGSGGWPHQPPHYLKARPSASLIFSARDFCARYANTI